MAITVYSQKFKREIDIEQLLSLLGHNSLVDINTKIYQSMKKMKFIKMFFALYVFQEEEK